MANAISKRLVIDTSVLCFVSEKSTAQSPKSCLEFLEAVRKICHRIVLTPDLKAEINKHRNPFSLKWLSTMQEHEKVFETQMSQDTGIRKKIESSFKKDEGRDVMLKDLLLIEAAMASDQIIVSLDESARNHFYETAKQFNEFKSIVWVNPTIAEEEAITWLEEGAPPDQRWLLGQ